MVAPWDKSGLNELSQNHRQFFTLRRIMDYLFNVTCVEPPGCEDMSLCEEISEIREGLWNPFRIKD